MAVFVFLPVPARRERRVGIGGAVARDAGATPSLEGERLHDFDAIAPAEAKRAGVGGGGQRVAPQKQTLGAGPDAVQHAPLAVFAQQVAVAVAEEAAGSGAELHQAGSFAPGLGPFDLADIGLVVGHAEVLGPVLGRNLDGKSGGHRGVHHGLVHALGVHVDLDLAAAGGDALEDGLPELVAAFFDAALAVDPEGDAADCGTGFQQRPDGIAAVGPVRIRGKPFDGVVAVSYTDLTLPT